MNLLSLNSIFLLAHLLKRNRFSYLPRLNLSAARSVRVSFEKAFQTVYSKVYGKDLINCQLDSDEPEGEVKTVYERNGTGVPRS